jgi:acyl dehydratase
VKTFDGLDEFEQAVGSHLGYSEWHTLTQQQIDLFAEATGDRQWIHVDPERAKAGPFGTTIAHGYLTLSMLPTLVAQIYRVEGVTMRVNYGADKVRFPSPVPVSSRIRAGAELVALDRRPSGTRATVRVTVEREGGDKPACVADVVSVLVD